MGKPTSGNTMYATLWRGSLANFPFHLFVHNVLQSGHGDVFACTRPSAGSESHSMAANEVSFGLMLMELDNDEGQLNLFSSCGDDYV